MQKHTKFVDTKVLPASTMNTTNTPSRTLPYDCQLSIHILILLTNSIFPNDHILSISHNSEKMAERNYFSNGGRRKGAKSVCWQREGRPLAELEVWPTMSSCHLVHEKIMREVTRTSYNELPPIKNKNGTTPSERNQSAKRTRHTPITIGMRK